MKYTKRIISVLLIAALSVVLLTAASAISSSNDAKSLDSTRTMMGLKLNSKDTVIRADAARAMAYMALGSDADKLEYAPGVLNDVGEDTPWAACINYCYEQGIVNGTGTGTFLPNNEVTGYQLAKMLLITLGAGKAEDYIGADWQDKVSTAAMAAGLTLPEAPDVQLSGESFAKLIISAVKAEMAGKSSKIAQNIAVPVALAGIHTAGSDVLKTKQGDADITDSTVFDLTLSNGSKKNIVGKNLPTIPAYAVSSVKVVAFDGELIYAAIDMSNVQIDHVNAPHSSEAPSAPVS